VLELPGTSRVDGKDLLQDIKPKWELKGASINEVLVICCAINPQTGDRCPEMNKSTDADKYV
jgi:hypothetical protein